MHIDWNWIKQRPHFIAEGLSHFFKVDAWHEKTYAGKRNLVNNSTQKHPNLSVQCIKRLPFSRFCIIYHINVLINRIILRKCYKNADIIWVPYSLYLPYYKKNNRQTIVYDCMDDILEFDLLSTSVKKRIMKYEKCLINQADIVIASSDYLRNILIERHGVLKPIEIVNNAISLPPGEQINPLPDFLTSIFADKSTKKIVFIGTISTWLDFDLILQSLKENNNIEYLLFGPCEVKIPPHPKIKVFGAVEYKYVFPIMRAADCLVMPFVVSDLVKSMNPVKVYEYIYASKPVIIPLYGETQQFKEYVYLYQSAEEYAALLNDLTHDRLNIKQTEIAHHNFALRNTWDNRVDEIRQLFLKHGIV